ncbi:MAG TPA: SAM-dependent methyltransferase, partial [Chitinispirillaceae bacterium]|nr:SAM-dependent methyltransferase [Chitinispirillaceae bacterium]
MALYIVATPIGNLEDMTFRAVKVLKEVDLVLAEDTRVSRNLLTHYGITTPVSTYHDFNKEKLTPILVERLKKGESMALISDAG